MCFTEKQIAYLNICTKILDTGSAVWTKKKNLIILCLPASIIFNIFEIFEIFLCAVSASRKHLRFVVILAKYRYDERAVI